VRNNKDIVREAASQRRHYRFLVPLNISMGGQKYTTQDWSLGGLSIYGYDGDAKQFDEFDIEISSLFGNDRIHIKTQIRVSRYDADKQKISAEFSSLKEKHRTLLEYFADSLGQEEMGSADSTRPINTQVTLVSEKPDLILDESMPPRRRATKTSIISVVYFLLGICLSYYIINTMYTNVFKLRVDTATITGSDRVIEAPVSGVIDEIYANMGDFVSTNAPLLYIRNEDTLENIEMARIEIRNAQIDLNEKQQQLEAQQKELQSYRTFSIHKLQIAKVKTTGLKEKLRLAEKRRKRISQLHADGTVSEETLDNVDEQLAGLRAELDVAISEQKIADLIIKEIDNGYYFTDKILIGKIDELQTAITAAYERVELEKERFNILEMRRQRLVIFAPIDGKVLSLYANKNQLVTKGEALLLIEKSDGERGVEAFISVKDMENVTLNQSVKVIINSKEQALNAKVTSTEWMTKEDGMLGFVRVKLTFFEKGEQEAIATLPSGLPVVVEFPKGSLSEYFF